MCPCPRTDRILGQFLHLFILRGWPFFWFQWLLDAPPPSLAVFCLGVTVQRGHSRLGCSRMQQKQQQKKVKERWEDWCVRACAGAGGAARLLPTHRCHPPACPVSQRSGSWLVFSDDVTVPSADYAWLERTSAAAPLRTPACMWRRHKHTSQAKDRRSHRGQQIQIWPVWCDVKSSTLYSRVIYVNVPFKNHNE